MVNLIIGQKCLMYDREKDKVLLLKRTDYKKDWGENSWDIPGGKLEDFDAELDDEMRREVEEEIGGKLHDLQIIHSYKEPLIEGGGYFIFYLYLCDNFELPEEGPKLSDEHNDFKWVSVEEMVDHKYMRSIEGSKAHILPFFDKYIKNK